ALTATASVTNGTISNPLFSDDNGGKQVAGRLEWRPTAGLGLGTSLAHGAFVSESAANIARPPAPMSMSSASRLSQAAWGADVEYSRDYYVIRAETILSAWHVPFEAQPTMNDPLRASSVSIEGRYKLTPAFYTAARYDHLGFSTVTGSSVSLPWD